MAFDDIEIEIKIPVTEEEFNAVKQKLVEIGKFIKISKHVDKYLTPHHRDFFEPQYPFEWLSTRNRDGKLILNYKHFYPENSKNTTHCDEFETHVNDPDQLNKILTAINVKSKVIVNKEREIYVYEDKFEIAMDKVNELGHFIEIEALKSLGTIEETRNQLLIFAQFLGIDSSQEVCKGYPFLLMQKKGLI